MVKRTLFLVAILAAFTGLMSSAQAQIVLSINAEDKTLTFTGSSEGTPDSNFVDWSSSTPIDPVEMDISEGFNETFILATLRVSTDGTLTLHFETESNSLLTISGNGVTFSYENQFDPTEENYISTFSGNELALITGSGFDNAEVQQVPEPTVAGLLLGAAALGLLRRRRA